MHTSARERICLQKIPLPVREKPLQEGIELVVRIREGVQNRPF